MMDWWTQWKWEEVCGPAGLQPWNDLTKDIGLCAQQMFLQFPAYVLLAVVSSYYIGYKVDWVVRNKLQERAIIIRSFSVLGLFVLPAIELYVILTRTSQNLYLIDYMMAAVAFISWLIHFVYVLALKHRLGSSSRGPTFPLIIWSLLLVLNVISLRSIIIYGDCIMWFSISSLICHIIYLLTLIPSDGSRRTHYSPFLVGSHHFNNEYTPLMPHVDDDVLGTAMQGSGFFSKLTFSWVEPLFLKGLAKKLSDPEELFDLPSRIRCAYVGAKLDRALIGNVDRFQRYEEVPHEPFISSGYGATGRTQLQASTPVTPTYRVLVRPERRQNVSLLRALHSCFALQFYSIGFLKLISDMAGFAGPLLLNKLIIFIEQPNIDIHWGYLYAGGLAGASLISAFSIAQFNWLMSLIGLKMQGAIVYIIFTKTLSVSPTELTKVFSVGEITNFMSTDTDRIVNSCPSFHALWSIPLQLAITLYLLYQQVGLSVLAGIGFSIVLIPVNKLIANKIGSLSTEMMKHKDARVSLMSDLIRGIRAVKTHVWEDFFIDKVNESRDKELSKLRGRKYLDAICVVLWASTPVLVAAFTLGTHALRKQSLDAATVFTTVALINMLIAPLNAFPWVLNGLTEAWVSIKRIQKLLDLPDSDSEKYYDRLDTNKDEENIISIKNATFSWDKPSIKHIRPKGKHKKHSKVTPSDKLGGKNNDNNKGSKNSDNNPILGDKNSDNTVVVGAPFVLKDINVNLGRREFLGVTGSVGSGKTSLLHSLIGMMVKKEGSIQVAESLDGFGYVSQKPWLVSGTVRDNILFGLPYEESKFRKVMEVCALTDEMDTLCNKMVGEGGCTLSGGQRMRISLARAVYADKAVYLLDDVLSCVDASVAQHILTKCILGYLKGTARVLVAHSVQHLSRADRVIVMKEGEISAVGSPQEILNNYDGYMTSDSEMIGDEPEINGNISSIKKKDEDAISRTSSDNEETMNQGTVEWCILFMYLRSVGGFLTVAILLSLVLMQISQNFTFLWLTFWLRSRSNSTSRTIDNMSLFDHGFDAIDSLIHGIDNYTKVESTGVQSKGVEYDLDSNDEYYLTMYFVLAAVNVVFTVMRAFLFAYGGVKAANKIHKVLLKVVIKAKVKFFDTTPVGRILNRFSSDLYTVDDSLPFIMNILLAQTFGFCGAIIICLYGLPWVAIVLVPLIPIYHWIQKRYRLTSRQLKRLQSVTRSPIYTHFSDTLEGLAHLRSECSMTRSVWQSALCERVCVCVRCACSASAASAWLALRLQVAGAALTAAAGIAAVARPGMVDAGTVGLVISYALSMTSMVGNVMSSFTETEREMVAVERVGEYIQEIECENMDGDPPPYGWPSQGVITFDDVVVKYSENDSVRPALNGVSFECYPCERIGVVGRTGAGKSSLVQLITRMTQLYTGRVLIDGIDVSTLHLHALRSRISVIPQEPFIFHGSIRENIDPLQLHTDEEIYSAMRKCGVEGLNLDADAMRQSRGLAQLLCLTRTVLQKAKIVLIDEATANLDNQTEGIILDTIRTNFSRSTVLFVAHRVRGVLECSRVLVLSSGQIMEFDSPDVLLEDTTSHLYRLVHAHEQ